MQISVAGGKKKHAVTVADSAFAREFNEGLVHQVVTAYMAGSRSGSKAQKTRSEVRGGGRKPWRQKGTGRARAGTIRSPLWRSGGQTFAAKPRDYAQKVNRKMYRAAMRCILSELVRQDSLVVSTSLTLDAPKTREVVKLLSGMKLSSVLIVLPETDEQVYLAVRNLPNVGICSASEIDPVVLLRFEKVLMTVDALKKVEESLK